MAGGSVRSARSTAIRTRSRGPELTVDAEIVVRAARGRSVPRQRPLAPARATAWHPGAAQPASSSTVVPGVARPATASGRPALTRAPALGEVMVIVVFGVAVATGVRVEVARGVSVA
jgi:hypothetical protein